MVVDRELAARAEADIAARYRIPTIVCLPAECIHGSLILPPFAARYRIPTLVALDAEAATSASPSSSSPSSLPPGNASETGA